MGIGQNLANFGTTFKKQQLFCCGCLKKSQWCINIFQKGSFFGDLVGEDPGTLGTL